MAIVPANNPHALFDEVNGNLDFQNFNSDFIKELGTNTKLIEFIKTALAPTSWVTPTLVNGWANYEIGVGFRKAAYRKSFDNKVQLRGLIKHPTTATPVANAFTLPSGYRPSEQEVFYSGGLYTGVGQSTFRVDVSITGEVIIYGNTVNTTDFMSISPISFYAD